MSRLELSPALVMMPLFWPTNDILYDDWYLEVTGALKFPDSISDLIQIDAYTAPLAKRSISSGQAIGILSNYDEQMWAAVHATSKRYVDLGLLCIYPRFDEYFAKLMKSDNIKCGITFPDCPYQFKKTKKLEVFNNPQLRWLEANNSWKTTAYDIVSGLPKYVWVSINLNCLRDFSIVEIGQILDALHYTGHTVCGFEICNIAIGRAKEAACVTEAMSRTLLLSQGRIKENREQIEGLNDDGDDEYITLPETEDIEEFELMYKIVKAITNGKGPKGESSDEIRKIILDIMKPYNMHHVPSPEMDELDLERFYLALHDDGNYVGASGYKMLSTTQGKTTLLAVLPEYASQGIGIELQKVRVEEMRRLGAKSVITNADRPKSISWYKKQGYFEVGKIDKIHSFGLDTVNQWTTLELKITDD